MDSRTPSRRSLETPTACLTESSSSVRNGVVPSSAGVRLSAETSAAIVSSSPPARASRRSQRGGEVDGEPAALRPAPALGEQQPRRRPSPARAPAAPRRAKSSETRFAVPVCSTPATTAGRQQVPGAPVAHVEEVLDAARVARLHDEQRCVPVGLDAATAGPRPPGRRAHRPRRLSPENRRAARTLACHSRSLSYVALLAERTSCCRQRRPEREEPERGVVLPCSSRSFHARAQRLDRGGELLGEPVLGDEVVADHDESNRVMPHLLRDRSRAARAPSDPARARETRQARAASARAGRRRRRSRVACAGASWPAAPRTPAPGLDRPRPCRGARSAGRRAPLLQCPCRRRISRTAAGTSGGMRVEVESRRRCWARRAQPDRSSSPARPARRSAQVPGRGTHRRRSCASTTWPRPLVSVPSTIDRRRVDGGGERRDLVASEPGQRPVDGPVEHRVQRARGSAPGPLRASGRPGRPCGPGAATRCRPRAWWPAAARPAPSAASR